MIRRPLIAVAGMLAAAALGSAGEAAGQPLGTFRWQLQPYCNPAALAGAAPLTRPEDLREHVLLHVVLGSKTGISAPPLDAVT